MNGAEIMQNNQKIYAKVQILLDRLASLPDVKAIRTGDMTASLHINEHYPLVEVLVRYTCRNRLWSQNYDVTYSCQVESRITSPGYICYDIQHGHFTDKNHSLSDICAELNANPFLSKLLCSIDLHDFHIELHSGITTVHLTPMTGGITKLVIPPVTQLILPTEKECIAVLQILQLTASHMKGLTFNKL